MTFFQEAAEAESRGKEARLDLKDVCSIFLQELIGFKPNRRTPREEPQPKKVT